MREARVGKNIGKGHARRQRQEREMAYFRTEQEHHSRKGSPKTPNPSYDDETTSIDLRFEADQLCFDVEWPMAWRITVVRQ